jgi:uncharacterized membrane protein YidH (DUF202 family)
MSTLPSPAGERVRPPNVLYLAAATLFVGGVAAAVGPFLAYVEHRDGSGVTGAHLGSTGGGERSPEQLVGLLDVVGGVLVVALSLCTFAVIAWWSIGRQSQRDARRHLMLVSAAVLVVIAVCAVALVTDWARVDYTIGWAGGELGSGLRVTATGVTLMAVGGCSLLWICKRLSASHGTAGWESSPASWRGR